METYKIMVVAIENDGGIPTLRCKKCGYSFGELIPHNTYLEVPGTCPQCEALLFPKGEEPKLYFCYKAENSPYADWIKQITDPISRKSI